MQAQKDQDMYVSLHRLPSSGKRKKKRKKKKERKEKREKKKKKKKKNLKSQFLLKKWENKVQ